jgi:aryl-alcohol dehydrogenase-like predicted oxidoreductase
MHKKPLGRSGLLHLATDISAAMSSAGPSTSAPRSPCWTPGWTPASTPIDTADVYSAWVPGHTGGESETVIGKWLRTSGKRRPASLLATKVGKPMGPELQGLRPDYIRAAVEASLRRLQTDHIDLYQSHDDDQDTPLEDTLGAFTELIQAGKVRAIGASNYSAERLALALDTSRRHGLARYETLQPLYNLADRAVFEDALQPLCVREDVGVINFYALAAGFLTGKYRDPADAGKSARGANTVRKYLNPRGLRILAALDSGGRAQHQTRPGVVAVAWLLTRAGVTSPIASATSLDATGRSGGSNPADACSARPGAARRGQRAGGRRPLSGTFSRAGAEPHTGIPRWQPTRSGSRPRRASGCAPVRRRSWRSTAACRCLRRPAPGPPAGADRPGTACFWRCRWCR